LKVKLKNWIARLMLPLALLTSASMLTACGVSTSTNAKIVLTPLPAALITCVDKAGKQIPCCVPVVLPERGLTKSEVEKFWREDRTNLRLCKKRLDAIESYYEDLRSKLDSTSP
jgi:hypothetical protein